jgi:hypothetical protein
MENTTRHLDSICPSGARSLYEARVFKEICVVASAVADKILRAN